MPRKSIGERPMTDADARQAVVVLGPLEHWQSGYDHPDRCSRAKRWCDASPS